MEQRAISALLGTLNRKRLRSALLFGAILGGCSSAALLYTTKPARSTRPLVLAPPVASVAAPPAPVSLDGFSPFLTDPEFAAVRDALEAADSRRAAESLAALLERSPALGSPTLALFSGRLWEAAGDAQRALVACERAASPGSVLAGYAELCSARMLVALGRPSDALTRLGQQSFDPPLESERQLVIARAAQKAGDRASALVSLRAVIESLPEGAERSRTRLELAQALLDKSPTSAEAVEALALTRTAIASLAPVEAERRRAEALERQALALLPAEDRARLAEPLLTDRVRKVAALVDARSHQLAEAEAGGLLRTVSETERFSDPACEVRLLLAKALSGQRKYGAAVEALADARARCSDDRERGARIWFLSGRYAAQDSSYVPAIQFYAQVEQRYPENSLADDSRLHAAMAYDEIGVPARFTELLLSLPEAYPNGDMGAEALFRLALRRMDRGSWTEALGLLERGIALVGDRDAPRGADLAGRERYFRARALLSLGKRDQGVAELSAIVDELPLSYYMLAAFSRLEKEAPERARSALEGAATRAEKVPFRAAPGQKLEQPGFRRMLELLRIGELASAVRELDHLGLRNETTASEILWRLAALYERAGFSKFSTELARMRFGEVVGRWPVGDWKRAWEIAYPRPYLDLVQREAAAAGVETSLAYAIMREESAFDPEAVSPANAYGLMQLIVPTARQVAKAVNLPSGPEALKRPRINVALGCRELGRLGRLFAENPLLAIPAYNAGPGRPERWLRERPGADFDLWVELIPFPETRRYTKRVLASRATYVFLYEPPEAARTRLALPLKLQASGT